MQARFKEGDRVRSLISNTIGDIICINPSMARVKPIFSSEAFWVDFNDIELYEGVIQPDNISDEGIDSDRPTEIENLGFDLKMRGKANISNLIQTLYWHFQVQKDEFDFSDPMIESILWRRLESEIEKLQAIADTATKQKSQNTPSPINPEHYPNAGTSKDLIAHWLDIGWESAIAANIQKYTERSVVLQGDDKLRSLRKAQEYLRRWIEFVESK